MGANVIPGPPPPHPFLRTIEKGGAHRSLLATQVIDAALRKVMLQIKPWIPARSHIIAGIRTRERTGVSTFLAPRRAAEGALRNSARFILPSTRSTQSPRLYYLPATDANPRFLLLLSCCVGRYSYSRAHTHIDTFGSNAAVYQPLLCSSLLMMLTLVSWIIPYSLSVTLLPSGDIPLRRSLLTCRLQHHHHHRENSFSKPLLLLLLRRRRPIGDS